jgi:predicted amidohydrolase YtcJ
LAAAAALDDEGRLNMYYSAAVVFNSLEGLPQAIAQVRRLQEGYGREHVNVQAVKLFLDGTNEVRTGAVLEPFLGDGDYGTLRMSEEDLTAALMQLNDEAIDIHIHLVGDRAFRIAMNAVEDARKAVGDAWRIQVTTAHNELIDAVDVARPAELGVILNVTPHWVGGEMGTAAADTLGWDRFNAVYRYNPMIDAGCRMDFSSDVASANEADRADPFLGMEIAHTRTDARYPMPPGPGTVPDTTIRQPASARIALSVLLDGYTRNGAVQLRLAHRMGSIETGKLANLSVLTQTCSGCNPTISMM